MAKRPSFGLTGPVPVVSGLLGADPVDAEVVQFLRRRRSLMTVQQIAQLDNPGSPAGTVPQPTSLSEAVHAASTIAGMHKGVAEVAMAERAAAELRTERLAAETEDRVEKARQMEAVQGATMLQVVQQFAQASQENLKQAYESRIQLQGQVAESQMKAVEARVEGLLSRHEEQLRQKDAKINELEGTMQRLSGRESLEERLVRLLVSGDRDDPIISLVTKHFGAGGAPTDPNTIYQMGLAEVEVDKARRGLVKADQEIHLEQARHEMALKFVEDLRGLIGTAREWLPRFIGQARGMDHNGVPSSFPAATMTEGGFTGGSAPQ